jgi:hypothetical protein
MMTPEKPTMVDMSGGKRDRSSDHTDKPATTPNTRDTKLLCDDDMEAIGKGNEGKLVEIEQKPNSAVICNDDDGVTSAFVKPDQKEVIDVDDLDSIIASGGLVESPGSDTDEHVPKTLFDPKDDKTDETTEVTEPSDVHDDDGIANALANFSPPIKNKQIDDNAAPTSTEKNNNNKNNNKKQKKNRKTNKVPTPSSNPTKARRMPLSSLKKASNSPPRTGKMRILKSKQSRVWHTSPRTRRRDSFLTEPLS